MHSKTIPVVLILVGIFAMSALCGPSSSAVRKIYPGNEVEGDVPYASSVPDICKPKYTPTRSVWEEMSTSRSRIRHRIMKQLFCCGRKVERGVLKD